MNPQLILNAAKAAYENREVAVKLLNKIRDWKDGSAEEKATEEKELSMEERVALLEKDASQKSLIFKEQSELLAGLAENVAALSLTTQRLMKRMNMLTVLMVLSFILSVTALIAALFD